MLVRSLTLLLVFGCLTPSVVKADLQAGAAVIDVTPLNFPVLVNGGMLSRTISKVKTKVHARSLVLTDGTDRIAIVVVDSCMIPRPVCDDIKERITREVGIPADQVLISATHTHTAPSSMGALGTAADLEYIPYLKDRVTEVVRQANASVQPCRIGYASGDAGDFTALRRWIRRPDRIDNDPFGNPTVRANMHAATNWDNVTGPSGSEDPSFSMISIQTEEGSPIAVLANYSMHYFGDRDISADYFGLFCAGLKQRIAPNDEFVGILSHGCSGDIWRRDYEQAPEDRNDKLKIDEYTTKLLDIAMTIYDGIEYESGGDLEMVERRMTLPYRTPNKQLLEWSEGVVEAMGDRPPKTREEVYAREQIILHERQKTEIVVQALRIGDIAIATTPNETYALTGLKVKAGSPLAKTMVIELANGGDGYIPPPEQHILGGYNTWAARSAGLEVNAEPKITEALLELLEQVTEKPRREPATDEGDVVNAIANEKPSVWYRMDEMSGPLAIDETTPQQNAMYEPGVVFFLPGPAIADGDVPNRGAMFAGGRMRTHLPQLAKPHTIECYFWNGMPSDGRGVTGWLLSRGYDLGLASRSEHVGISGTANEPARLMVQFGADEKNRVLGRSEVYRWNWQHVRVEREPQRLRIYLNNQLEIDTAAPALSGVPTHLFVGGRCDNTDNFEGRIDEVLLFEKVRGSEETK